MWCCTRSIRHGVGIFSPSPSSPSSSSSLMMICGSMCVVALEDDVRAIRTKGSKSYMSGSRLSVFEPRESGTNMVFLRHSNDGMTTDGESNYTRTCINRYNW